MTSRTPTRIPPYDLGTHCLGDGVWAYLQPPGTWGFGNAGLVAGVGESLLVDTLNDLITTRTMLDSFADVLAELPVRTLVNTCGESDHCWGNQLVAGSGTATISTPAAWEELQASQPAALAQVAKLVGILPKDMKRVARAITEPFSFKGIRLTPPTRFIEGDMTLECGGRTVQVLDLGGARSRSDLAVWVPDAGVLFAGDLVVSGNVPLLEGDPATWRSALSRFRSLNPRIVVPGRGPVGDAGLLDDTERFLSWLEGEVSACHSAGHKPGDAVVMIHRALRSSEFAELKNAEKLVVSVHALWRALSPDHRIPDPPVLYTQMGRLMA